MEHIFNPSTQDRGRTDLYEFEFAINVVYRANSRSTRTRVEILPQRKNCFKEKGKLVLKGWCVHIVPAKVRESGQSVPGLQRLSIDCSYISLSEERNSNSQSQRKWWYHVYTSEQQSKLCLSGVRRQMELFC